MARTDRCEILGLLRFVVVYLGEASPRLATLFAKIRFCSEFQRMGLRHILAFVSDQGQHPCVKCAPTARTLHVPAFVTS